MSPPRKPHPASYFSLMGGSGTMTSRMVENPNMRSEILVSDFGPGSDGIYRKSLILFTTFLCEAQIRPKTTVTRKREYSTKTDALVHAGYAFLTGRGSRVDKQRAATLFRKAAECGSGIGANNLAAMLDQGDGIAENAEKAAFWYALAAKSGVASAQFNLGFLFETGRGVPRDYERAAELYQQAAQGNEPTAYANLGTLYARGLGVSRDGNKAVEYWRQAAELGEAIGAFNLGVFFAGGHGAGIDFGRAHYWFSRAQLLGHPDAAAKLSEIEPVMTRKEDDFSKKRLARLVDMTRTD